MVPFRYILDSEMDFEIPGQKIHANALRSLTLNTCNSGNVSLIRQVTNLVSPFSFCCLLPIYGEEIFQC